MGTRGGRRSVLVAVVVGMLLLPLVSGGGDARAAREGQVAIPVRQQQGVDDGSSEPRGAAAAETQAQKHPKMDGSLTLVSSAAAGRIGPSALEVARSRDLSVTASGQVRVIVESAGPRSRAVAAVQAVGGTVEAEYQDLVQALVAPGMLAALAADPTVAFVRVPARPRPEAVSGEGVAASGASVWQAAGFTGQGVKVGVVDSGFTGYQLRQSQGDLPSNLTVVDNCSGQVTPPGGEHGAAVAEIVYEMAPGIQLYLLCASTEVQLGLAKEYAKANGLSIIVMSVSYFNTSRGDGTGPAGSVTATVNDARASGILWVNAAGNRAQQHYSAIFSDTDGNGNHNYTPTDNGNTIFLLTNDEVCVFLRWDAWPTTNQDFDLYLQTSLSGVNVAQSTGFQTGTQRPTEELCYTNTTGSSQNFAIVVRKFSATTNPFFDLFIFPFPNLEHQVAAGSVTEPGSSPSALAVGAICWQNDRRESYSSQGPTIDGRIKPDIAGQSVVSSASYPPPPVVSCPANADGQGGFNGTSAATPHVGGAAALVKGANPTFAAGQIQSFLEGRAVDLGPAGKDNLFGVGKLALGSAPLAPVTCSPRPAVTVSSVVTGGRLAVTVRATGTNNNVLSIAFVNGARQPVNSLLDLPDGRTGVTGSTTWTGSGSDTQTTFFVRRQAAGAVTVPFVVTDRCGTWPSFAGGGASATGF